MAARRASRYPAVSRPAGDFGAAACGPASEPPWRRLALAGLDQLELVCPRPLHHVLEFAGLYRVIEGLRDSAPAVRLRLWYRSALAGEAPFRGLPVDRLERLAARDEAPAPARLLDRLAGRGAAAALLVGGTAASREPLDEGLGIRLLGELPLDFRIPWPESAASQAASDRFFGDLAAASPAWRSAASSPAPPPPERPLEVLFHQSRFRIGDTLWATPLLRALRHHLPAARITVAGSPVAERVLARCRHVDALLLYDPAGGEAERARVRDALAGHRFDAALFAFARREKSRWLAEAAAELGVRWRVNVEYFEGADDVLLDPEPFTHEGRFFWNTLPSPSMLLEAAAPLLAESTGGGARPSDRRVEFAATTAERRAAADLLATTGVAEAPFVILAPGGSSSERWPAERFASLAGRLAGEAGIQVFIEGGPGDGKLFAEIAAALDGSPGVHLRRDPLGVLAALLERAALLVSNDSAPIHLAEAVGTPTLYFAQQEKLTHSHPARHTHWALFDGVENRVANIAVGQAEAAARALLLGAE